MKSVMAPDDVMLQAAPGLRFDRYRDQINASIQSTLKRGQFVGGPQVQQLEQDLVSFLGIGHAVSCNSGTDALFLSLSALGIAQGHQVIVPSLTAAGTAVAVLQTGATPRFCDVNRTTRNVDIETIKSAMTDDVKAIIVVHLHGSPVDLNPILAFAHQHNIAVIEDCAQAIGATYQGAYVGTFGTAAAFSFYPTKNLGCLGDGGAVALNDARLADKIRSMCSYGWDTKKMCAQFGVNSRLDALQAAVLSALFPYLNEGNAERVAAAQIYVDALKDTQISLPFATPGSVYHQFAIEVEDRDGLMAYLSQRGIGTGVHYATGLHEEPHFQQFVETEDAFPNTTYLARHMCSLPIQPELMHNQGQVIKTLLEYTGK